MVGIERTEKTEAVRRLPRLHRDLVDVRDLMPLHFAQKRWYCLRSKKNWFVYAKPPFAGPEAVLAYLARYTHRVAISNSRLIGLDEAAF